MSKFVFFVVSISILTLATSSAAIYKGQRTFSKQCVSCHENAPAVVSSKTMAEWKKLLNENGIGLSKIHLTNDKAKGSWKYFYGKSYTKKVKHLKDFLIEYAKDSGNVPACN